jgi:hypothetical protein
MILLNQSIHPAPKNCLKHKTYLIDMNYLI